MNNPIALPNNDDGLGDLAVIFLSYLGVGMRFSHLTRYGRGYDTLHVVTTYGQPTLLWHPGLPGPIQNQQATANRRAARYQHAKRFLAYCNLTATEVPLAEFMRQFAIGFARCKILADDPF